MTRASRSRSHRRTCSLKNIPARTAAGSSTRMRGKRRRRQQQHRRPVPSPRRLAKCKHRPRVPCKRAGRTRVGAACKWIASNRRSITSKTSGLRISWHRRDGTCSRFREAGEALHPRAVMLAGAWSARIADRPRSTRSRTRRDLFRLDLASRSTRRPTNARNAGRKSIDASTTPALHASRALPFIPSQLFVHDVVSIRARSRFRTRRRAGLA